MSMFSSALASGQLGPLMNQFGLSAEAVDAANRGGRTNTLPYIMESFIFCKFNAFVHLFLRSLVFLCLKHVSVSSSDVEAFARAMQGSKGDSKEKKEDDEDMSLD